MMPDQQLTRRGWSEIRRRSSGEHFFLHVSRHEYHDSVLLDETLEAFAPVSQGLIVDGTLGGGGHSEALLGMGGRVIGIDQDAEAIAYAGARLGCHGDRFAAVRANFAGASAVLAGLGVGQVDGVLLDLGVSSHQLDEAARGFSFQRQGPLDMRMDDRGSATAADLVNTLGAAELERIFREYGEEPHARRIAAAVVKGRAKAPLMTTLELAALVERVVPRSGRAHPATRVFQALRIAVNRELEVLEQALEVFVGLLRPGGRMAVITFHSLEDRIVKQFFARCSAETIDRPEWPAPRPNPELSLRRVTRKAVVAGVEEQRLNPRARSAKLRVAEKL
jgi:16S rRNA (cytosine1402-N4)-methyltransferase